MIINEEQRQELLTAAKPLMEWLRKHCHPHATAIVDVESGDYDPGDENAAIRACVGDAAVLDAAIEQAHEAAKVLRAELEMACRGRVIEKP